VLLNPFCTFSTAKVLALKPTVLLLFQTLGSWPSAVGVCSQLGGGSTGESPTAPGGIGLRLPLAIPIASLTWEQGT